MKKELWKQINEILKAGQVKQKAKEEAEEMRQVIEFHEKLGTILLKKDDVEEKDMKWLVREFNIYHQALKDTTGRRQVNELFPFVTFEMGRTYERFYKKGAV